MGKVEYVLVTGCEVGILDHGKMKPEVKRFPFKFLLRCHVSLLLSRSIGR